MKQFQLHLFNGHALINDCQNKILIDTGAPIKIHSSDTLIFCSDTYDCSKNYTGLTISKISDMLGTEITTLLGVDILAEYKVLFDYRNQVIVFSKEEIEFDGVETEISNFMGIPIIKMKIDNHVLKFFLDTGAKLSYLSDRFTSNYKSIGTEEDFYPVLGNFQTQCFEILTVFEGKEFLVKYGNLPTLLKMTLMFSGTDGIIGFDFFNNFKVVLNLKNNKLKYAI